MPAVHPGHLSHRLLSLNLFLILLLLLLFLLLILLPLLLHLILLLISSSHFFFFLFFSFSSSFPFSSSSSTAVSLLQLVTFKNIQHFVVQNVCFDDSDGASVFESQTHKLLCSDLWFTCLLWCENLWRGGCFAVVQGSIFVGQVLLRWFRGFAWMS